LDVSVTWWNVSKSYIVTGVSWDPYLITALNSGVATNSTSFISTGWVEITLSVIDDRVDVSTNATISVTKVYGWNSTPCALSTFVLNDTTIHGAVGRYGFEVSSLTETTYGITNFTTNSVYMIWDQLTVNYKAVDDDRRDVSTSGEVRFRLRSEYDSAFVTAGSISVNGSAASWDAGNSWWKLSVSQSSVCEKNYIVTAVSWSTYGITALNSGVSTNSTSIIWDRLIISAKHSNATSATVLGDPIKVWFKVRSELDGLFVSAGTLDINGSASTYNSTSGYWYLDVVAPAPPNLVSYMVTSVSWSTYGISALNAGVATNATSFASGGWIEVTLTVVDNRIDAGSNASITVVTVYGWNSTPCSLSAFALNDTTVKNIVGRYGFTVSSLTETPHGITVFASNSVFVIYDRVEGLLNLSGAIAHRINAGSNASLQFPQLWYAFDCTPFVGTVALNDTTIHGAVGRYGYKIASITDTAYGLTVFTTNSTYVIFDAIDVNAVTWTGMDTSGNVKLNVTLKSAFDSIPFKGHLSINGTVGQNSTAMTISFTRSGHLFITAINETNYGLTRAGINKTWCVYLSNYKVVSSLNLTLSIVWYDSSKILTVVTTHDVFYVACPLPNALMMNGFPKTYGDAWSYSAGVLKVNVTSTTVGIWFLPLSTPTFPGGNTWQKIYLGTLLVNFSRVIIEDHVEEIRVYRIDNVAKVEIASAWIIVGMPLQSVVSLQLEASKMVFEKYNSTASMFQVRDVRPNDTRRITARVIVVLPKDAGNIVDIGGFKMTFLQWVLFGCSVAIMTVLIVLGKGKGFIAGVGAFVFIYFGGSLIAGVDPLLVSYSLAIPDIGAMLDQMGIPGLAGLAVFFVVVAVILILARVAFGRKF
jgi:hypothetical protein